MLAQRNAEVHRGGADLTATQEYIPLIELHHRESRGEIHTGHRGHPAYGFHWFGSPLPLLPGTSLPDIGRNVYRFEPGATPTDAIETCRRYAALLTEFIQAFDQAHPEA